MESSTGGDGAGIGVECGVGTIVWVRRRNGSWWPGRILGLDELSASYLMSPRSGTPVKLLGREDASVDWYNLEKSKRVKAFRCGEFDACIERAEASQGTPIKKREKYARREDAILHALELEKQQLGLQPQKLGTTAYVISNKNSGSHRNEPSNFYSPESYMRHDEHVSHRNLSTHKPQNILTKTDFSQEGENLNDSSYANNRSNKQFRGEDDNSEATPRMRGLQDFGLRTAQSKRKVSQYVNWQKSRKPLDNYVEMQSGSGCMLEDAVHANSSKNCVSIKRKRSQSRLAEESLLKKRDRRRPLVQVLQSSAKLASQLFQRNYNAVGISIPGEEQVQSFCRAKRSRCVYLPRDSDEFPEHVSEPVLANQFGASKFLDNPADVEGYVSSSFIEENDSDSSEADYMGKLTNMLTDTAHVLLPGSKDCEPPEFQVSDKFRRLKDDDIPHSGLIPQLHEHITDASAEVGVSKWHMKGKRNNRNIGKRAIDAGDGRIYSAENCNGSMNETTYENKGGTSLNFERAELSNERALSWCIYPKRESFYNCDDSDLINKDLIDNQLNIYDEWRNPVPLQTTKDNGRSHSSLSLNDSDNNSHGIAPSIWEADEPSNLTHSAFWEEPAEHFQSIYANHVNNEMETLVVVVDVDLKVEASYQGEHVPLVSLMSRLNGKAIIGHPVQIEILESDSTIHLVPKFDSVTYETAAPPPMWRTGRRTAMQRVPRVNPLTTAVDVEDPSLFQYSDHGRKPTPNKKAYSGYLNHQTRLTKKSRNGSHTRQSRSKKFQKKNSNRISLLLLSQKTKTLSSFASSDKLGGGSSGVELTRSNDILEGLIKPEGSAPLVACVPVKVVFSRLLEAVGKPSSAAAHRIRMNGPAVRGLS